MSEATQAHLVDRSEDADRYECALSDIRELAGRAGGGRPDGEGTMAAIYRAASQALNGDSTP